MEPIVTSYAGLLDQSGFKQWYKYQKLRAAYGYDAEEVSFLMGKPSFYFRDYEMMKTAQNSLSTMSLRCQTSFAGSRWRHSILLMMTSAYSKSGLSGYGVRKALRPSII